MIWIALLLAFGVYLYFLAWALRGLQRLVVKSLPATQALPGGDPSPRPFSVIIAAHNEAGNIARCLEKLVHQNYPAGLYEIILAADRCTDATVAIARAFPQEFPRLKILEISAAPEGVSPKKHALGRAIEAAAHEHLLFLDADVVPTENHLRAMNRYFAGGAAAVVSLMKFFPPRSFWQKFLMFEKLVSWCIAGAGIGWERPLIAYGGNWGYTKSAFRQINGFAGLESSLGGDDDLLLQKIAEQRLPVQMCLEPQGWIHTTPPQSFRHFLRQRRRHFSAGKKYRLSLQVGYFLFHAANLVLWLGGLFPWPGLFFLFLKLAGDARVLRQGQKLFREEFSLPAMLGFEFLYLAYNTLIGPLGHLGRVKW